MTDDGVKKAEPGKTKSAEKKEVDYKKKLEDRLNKVVDTKRQLRIPITGGKAREE